MKRKFLTDSFHEAISKINGEFHGESRNVLNPLDYKMLRDDVRNEMWRIHDVWGWLGAGCCLRLS